MYLVPCIMVLRTLTFFIDCIVLKILIKVIKQSCQFTMAIASEPVRRLTGEKQACQKSETLLLT